MAILTAGHFGLIFTHYTDQSLACTKSRRVSQHKHRRSPVGPLPSRQQSRMACIMPMHAPPYNTRYLLTLFLSLALEEGPQPGPCPSPCSLLCSQFIEITCRRYLVVWKNPYSCLLGRTTRDKYPMPMGPPFLPPPPPSQPWCCSNIRRETSFALDGDPQPASFRRSYITAASTY